MTYGLEIKDPVTGNVVLSIDTATVKDRSIYANASVTSTGTISVPGATADSFVVISSNDDNMPPSAVLSGTTLTISASHDFDANIRILDFQ